MSISFVLRATTGWTVLGRQLWLPFLKEKVIPEVVKIVPSTAIEECDRSKQDDNCVLSRDFVGVAVQNEEERLEKTKEELNIFGCTHKSAYPTSTVSAENDVTICAYKLILSNS